MPTRRKRPRQQRSRDTVAAILEAATQLFDRDGYAATTTNGIAERAGVSIGSLYQYFAHKDAILESLAEQQVELAHAEVTRVFDEGASGEADRPSLERLLDALVRRIAALHTDRPQAHRLLFDQAPRTPELVACFRAAEQATADALAGELRRLGVGGPDPDLNALLAVQGIEAHVHGALLEPGASASTAEQRIAAITRLWVRALSEPVE